MCVALKPLSSLESSPPWAAIVSALRGPDISAGHEEDSSRKSRGGSSPDTFQSCGKLPPATTHTHTPPPPPRRHPLEVGRLAGCEGVRPEPPSPPLPRSDMRPVSLRPAPSQEAPLGWVTVQPRLPRSYRFISTGQLPDLSTPRFPRPATPAAFTIIPGSASFPPR